LRALVNRGPGRFEIENRPEPTPGAGELLLAPLFTGVCVSDKHTFEGRRFGPEWKRGLVLGHEFVATVAGLGAGVEGWSIGERVSVDPRIYCRECPSCRAGLPTLCERGAAWLGVADGRDGAFAELCLAPEYGCYRLPEAVGSEVAALLEPLASVTRCVRRSGLRIDDNVALIGLEDYALLALQRLRRAGVRAVVAIDPSPLRREAAAELGADVVIDPTAGGAARAVRGAMPNGADISFVAMEDYVDAARDYLQLAARVTRIQGSISILRTYGSAPYGALDPQIPYMKELTIRHAGAFFGLEPIQGGRERGDWQTSIEAIERGDVGALPGTRVVDFATLDEPGAVEDLFTAMPDRVTKTLVRISG
jgi:threonine dehydrogenase-like Zn-dependent dehydrogenase